MSKIRIPHIKVERVFTLNADGTYSQEDFLLTIRLDGNNVHIEQADTEERALLAAISYLKGEDRPNAVNTTQGVPAGIIPEECRCCEHLEELLVGLATGKKK